MSIRNKLLQDILSAFGGGGAVLWGSITGTIADQTDLAAVAKTNNFDDLSNKPAVRPDGGVFFVHQSGSDSNSGLTPELPLQTISEAIVRATALVPTEINQVAIEVIDSATYFESPTLVEWVHIRAPTASLGGRLTVADNTITRFRWMGNPSVGATIMRKVAGAGFAKVSVDRIDVTDAAQDGILVNSGSVHVDVGVLSVDAGVGIKAKNGSRVSFIVSEVQLLNGGLAIGTRTPGGDASSFSGNVLYAKDDGTGILLETRVAGDIINIQGGSFDVGTLYDLGANTTLNAFTNESFGDRIADPTANINVVNSNSRSRLTVSKGFVDQPLTIHNGTAGTETTLDFGTLTDKIYDISNGVMTLLQGVLSVQVLTETHVTKTTGGSNSEFSSWVEISENGGATWTPFPESLRVEVIDKDGGSVVISELTLGTPLAAGGMFRIRATNTGAAAISVLPPDDLVVSTGTADGFATKVTLRTLL